MAQNNLPLVAEVDFSAKGEDDAYYISTDMVDGIGNSVLPADLTTSMKLIDSTAADDKKSTFLDNTRYAITTNPVRLDSVRMADTGDGEWGFVVSGGKMGFNNQRAFTYTIGGLKNNGRYRVEVEYCNPLGVDYLNTSGSNKKPHLSSGYSAQIKIGTNASNMNPDGVQTTSLAGKSGSCLVASISNPLQPSGTQGPIAGGKLKVDVVISQLPAGQAIMIKGIKVYAEVEPTISGLEEVCTGGESVVLSIDNNYMKSTIQWYKGNTPINGATGKTYIHTSGKSDGKTTYHYVVTTAGGAKLTSKDFTVTDKKCCVDADGNPMSRKMIWQDDFGTFTSATKYWTWDYSDLSNPVKKQHTDAKGWVACSDVDITGANCEQSPFTEGAYSVAGNVTCQWDNSTTDGTQWQWEAQFGNGGKPKDNGWVFVPDHTYAGSDYGGMLFLNCNNAPDEQIYTRTIKGLCQKDLTVRCFVNTFSDGANDVDIYIKVTDKATGNEYKSKRITKSATGSVDWVPVEIDCSLQGSDMEFSIVSFAGGSNANEHGNDLVLDDIQIFACSNPSVDLYFNLSDFSKKEISCTGKEANIVPSDTLGLYVQETEMIRTNLKGKAFYVYQYSLDPEDAKSWKNIVGPVQDIKHVDLSSVVKDLGLKDKDKVYFRCVMGLKETLEDEIKNYGYYRPNAPCGEFSVSESIELTISCPVCYTPDKIKIVDKYDGVKQSVVKKTLCPGDAMTLNAEVKGTDGDGNDYTGYYLFWKENHAKSLPGGSKLQYFNKPKDMVIENDGSYTKETVVTYTVVAVDTFEFKTLDEAICKDSMDIEITMLPLPVIEDKEYEFCQGTPGPNDKWPTSMEGDLYFDYTINDVQPPLDPFDYPGSNINPANPGSAGNGKLPGPDFSTYSEGTYKFSYFLKTKAGCESKPANITIVVDALPTLTVNPVDEKCAGDFGFVLPSTGTDEVTGEEVTIDWGGQETDLDKLAGQTSDYVYTYVVTNAAGCKQEEKTLNIHAKPAVKINLLELETKCDLDILSVEIDPTAADREWTLDGSPISDDFASEWEGKYEKGELTLKATLAGYCDAEKTISVETKVSPLVLETSPVTYVKKTQAEAKVDLYTKSGNLTPKLSDGNEAADLILQYTQSPSTSATVPAGLTDADFSDKIPVPQAANVNDPKPETQYYYVRVYNKKTGCASDPVAIRVDFFGAPVPLVESATYCKGTSAKELSSYVKIDQSADPTASYTLKYYSDASKSAAAEIQGSVVPPTSEAGVVAYWATQYSVAGGESEPVEFTITTIDVLEPTVDPTSYNYCLNDVVPALTASVKKDEAKYFFADGLEWSRDGSTYGAADIVPSTDATGDATYYVRQNYTIASTGEVCVGEPVEIKVNVAETTPPTGTLKVSYLYSDLEKYGAFKDILNQDDKVVDIEAGYTYMYAPCDAAGTLTGTWSTEVPTPPGVSKEELNGASKNVYYAVKRISQSGAKCESQPEVITITISDSPMPITTPAFFCEGEDIPSLDNFVAISAVKKPADKYELLWFGSTEPDDLTLGGSTTPNAAPSSAIADGQPARYIYYVAQRDIETNAIGSASQLLVTVYPKPIVEITDPAAVCETAVDLAPTVKLTNSVLGASYSTAYFSDGNGETPISSSVDKSGTYYVQMSYPTMGASIAGSVCTSELMPVKVVVDELELTPVVDAETCPNTEGLLHAEVATNVASASFSWAAQASSDAKIDVQSVAGGAAQSDFTTTKLLGDAGTVFLYDLTVSAGTCSETQTGIKVTLGDGPVVGTLTLTEEENANSGKIYTSTRDVTADPFYMCGSGVTATAALEKDADSEFQWTNAAGSSVGTGASVTINTAGIYTITYSNNCATSMTFEVKDASIKNNVAIFSSKDLKASDDETLVICENEPVSVQLTYTAGNDASTVEWAKDDAPTSVVSGTTTSIAKATPDMSGVYKYTITNYGCEATGSVEAKVKPYIRFKPEQDLYIARRDSLLEIPTIISVPAAGTPSSISWTNKAGSEVNTTKDYLYTVDASDVFTITMSDDNYCDTTKTVEVIKDARLQLETSIDEKMCRGDKGVYLTIDTTGTGAIYYSDKAFITVTETIGEASHNISGWKLVDGKLQLEVHPTADATYTTTFLYREGEGVDEQKVVSETSIIVLQPIQIKVPTGLSVCAGDELEISLLSVTPEGSVVVNWQDDATITSGTSDTETITVVPEYDEETGRNHNSTKVYHLTASMEGCADKTEKVTITVNEPITGTLSDTTICEGFGVRLDASNYKAATYEWTSALVGNALGNSQTLYVTPEETSTYTVSMTRGNCKAEAEMTINVNSNPKIVSVDSLGCRKVQITLDESYGTAPYYYAVDDVSTYDLDPVKDGLKYTIHTAYVKDAVGCVAVAPFVVEQPTIIFPVWFSPNGDDVSGVWTPVNIQETYPEAEIRIFNRYGKEVGTFLGADPGWDGVYNGVDQPSTDYWFEVTVHEIDKVFTGHFTLIRR